MYVSYGSLYEVSRWAIPNQAVTSHDLGPQGRESDWRDPEGVSGILVCDCVV